MNWKSSILGIAAGVVCTHAGAVDTSYKANAAEMLRMPPYCQVKWNSPPTSPEWKAWRDRIGSNYIDLHHYCAGLNFINRYWAARNPQDRGFYLQSALNNFDYMVKAEKPDFALRAELYSYRGEVLKLMKRPGEAVRDFSQAIAIDPGFVKAYLQLADLNLAGQSKARALDVVTDGLRHVPDSTALQRRYLELGGKKPFPEPVVARAAEPAPAPAPKAAADPEPSAAASSAPAAAGETESPPIGMPGNPYCRFCPPE